MHGVGRVRAASWNKSNGMCVITFIRGVDRLRAARKKAVPLRRICRYLFRRKDSITRCVFVPHRRINVDYRAHSLRSYRAASAVNRYCDSRLNPYRTRALQRALLHRFRDLNMESPQPLGTTCISGRTVHDVEFLPASRWWQRSRRRPPGQALSPVIPLPIGLLMTSHDRSLVMASTYVMSATSLKHKRRLLRPANFGALRGLANISSTKKLVT